MIDEFQGGVIRRLHPDDQVKFVDIELADLPAGTPVEYRHTYQTGEMRIQSLYRIRRGSTIEIKRMRIPAGAIDGEPSPGHVYEYDGSSLQPSTDDVMAIRVRQRFAHFGGREMGILT